jgi:hypothetical protein
MKNGGWFHHGSFKAQAEDQMIINMIEFTKSEQTMRVDAYRLPHDT